MKIFRGAAPAFVAAALVAGMLALTGAPAAAEPTAATSTPFSTPNTDSCPNRMVPPKPIDSSEVPSPGQTSPSPVPVPDKPVGGEELGGCGVITPAGAPPLPADISATAWALFDLDSGQILGTKDPHGRYRPASCIKILLSLVALRELDMNTVVTGTTADADMDGTRVGIGPGGKYTNDQLMHALLMASGNDAAHAIAAQLGGDAATVAKMNAEAKQLGALDTRAATPSGLDGPGMSVSAYDMALFFRAAMKIPKFAEIIHTEQIQFPGYPPDPRIPGDKPHPGFPIGNDNHLLYNYDGALGGKTGYTDDARQTFVAGAERNGRRLGIVLLKADVLPIRPWEQAARLLDWGFSLPSKDSVGQLVDPNSSDSAETAGVPTPEASGDVTLAAPAQNSAPGSTSHAESDLDKVGGVKALVVIGGIIVVALLIGWAWRSASRRS
ncbi:D-alanyl-D-alanine carboxypeptidase [Skermania sp. ID1734]|uniref:D-alanyl-D-alanine carboxypeptidase family protein n=1 Tax=Skermania sp. ID1734 TaxID=2597516 RepID=UPI001180E330|nr:D-alanyl-D-alanine carboxypeptidase family protein [Skermania sp. ID1734]TSE02052.1 D-alanyl-D-alanine carboxypeptidase [Skermania sp. ID1734]